LTAIEIISSLLFAITVAYVAKIGIVKLSYSKKWQNYKTEWKNSALNFNMSPAVGIMPEVQIILSALTLIMTFLSKRWEALSVLPFILLLPIAYRHKVKQSYYYAIASQLDSMLINWANSLKTIPNLQGALEAIYLNEPNPIKKEIARILHEVKLGRTIFEALENFAARVKVKGTSEAVAAAIIGSRTGGNVSEIIHSTATTLQEMNRLDGVMKTKTSEGRNQAWVMGAVPPFFVLIMHFLDPEWMTPLWSDPIGWALVGLCIILELIAIILIRKITSVAL
jgi:tight adherence protein B